MFHTGYFSFLRFREKLQLLQSVLRTLQDQKESPKTRATWYAVPHNSDSHMAYMGKRHHYQQYITAHVRVARLLLFCLRREILCYRKSH